MPYRSENAQAETAPKVFASKKNEWKPDAVSARRQIDLGSYRGCAWRSFAESAINPQDATNEPIQSTLKEDAIMKQLLGLSAAIAILCSSGMAASADTIEQVVSTLQSTPPPRKTIKGMACGKGDAAKGIFSVRSADGVLCRQEYIAAFATLYCKGVGDYDQSHCAKNAKAALGGKDPKAVLKSAAEKGVGKAVELAAAALAL